MRPDDLAGWIAARYPSAISKRSWGETAFFVNPGDALPSGAYFATVKDHDGENDRASALDRDGVFRLNFGPGRPAFETLFGPPPTRPPKGGVVEGAWDFTRQDALMPHPIYGWMSWMCILNPTKESLDEIAPLLDKAFKRAEGSARQRIRKLAK